MLEFYLWGMFASAILCAVMSYFDKEDITIKECLIIALFTVFSWVGVLIFAAYFVSEELPSIIANNIDLNKVVYKRKK